MSEATDNHPSWWPKQGPTEFIRDNSDDGAAVVRALDAALEALAFCVVRLPDVNLADTGMSNDGVQALSRAAYEAITGPDENYDPS
jgi:hypothetical protein